MTISFELLVTYNYYPSLCVCTQAIQMLTYLGSDLYSPYMVNNTGQFYDPPLACDAMIGLEFPFAIAPCDDDAIATVSLL